MDDYRAGQDHIEIAAKFRPSLLGSRFPYYCFSLGTFGIVIMIAAIVLGVETK